jgi:protease-4
MNDLWQRFLADIAGWRKLIRPRCRLDIDALAERIQAVSGDLAELALSQKLVDGLKTQDEFRADADRARREPTRKTTPSARCRSTITSAARDDADRYREAPGRGGGGRRARSPTASSRPAPSAVSPRPNWCASAREDENVKALVLRVDSPGGGVFPSEQIRREVELTRAAGKPVVVSMGDVAASGGYWISMNADEIYADPSTITGSIGIFGLFFNIPDTLAKIGVRVDGVATTRIAGAFDPSRALDPAWAR